MFSYFFMYEIEYSYALSNYLQTLVNHLHHSASCVTELIFCSAVF